MSKDYKRFDLNVGAGLQYVNCGGLLWTTGHFFARKKAAKDAYDAVRTEVGKLPDLDRKMNEIAAHATGHAASCVTCKQEVSRILGQDWSPF